MPGTFTEESQNGAEAGQVHESIDGTDPISMSMTAEAQGVTGLGGRGNEPRVAEPAEPTDGIETVTDDGAGFDAGQQVVPADAPAAASTLQDWANLYGHYDLGQIQDPAELQAALFQRLSEAQQMAAYGQQFVPYQEQFQQFLAAQQQNQLQPQQPQYQQQVPQLPSWNPIWSQYLQTDPKTGKVSYSPYTPPQVRQDIENYAAWKEAYDRNPVQNTLPYMQPYVQQAVQQQVAQQMQQYAAQQAHQQTVGNLANWIDQQKGWIYQTDQLGNLITDPRTGQGVYSPAGAFFHQTIADLQRQGVRNPWDAINLARSVMQARYQPQQQAAQQPNQQQPMQQTPPARRPNSASRGLHNAANRIAGRGNSIRQAQTNGVPQGTRRSLSEKLAQALKDDGFTDENISF